MVVLTLGLGIGANTAIFSLVNTLVFRPLPFRAPDQLVRMRDAVARPGADPWLYKTSARSFVIMHEQATVFDGIVAQRHRVVNVTGRGDPLRITGIGVSADPSFGPQVTARLRDGLLLTTAQGELNELSRRTAETYPETHASVTFTAVPLRDDLVDNHPRLGWILLGAVGFLLLIGCANVASSPSGQCLGLHAVAWFANSRPRVSC